MNWALSLWVDFGSDNCAAYMVKAQEFQLALSLSDETLEGLLTLEICLLLGQQGQITETYT